MGLIACVPNVSEGRRAEVVEALAAAIRKAGVRLLDDSADPSHNRSVFTFAGGAEAIERAVVALYQQALASIDLRSHRGEHPRLGAVDVVPVVPLEGTAMAECVALARRLGAAVAQHFQVPVYLYGEAATDPARIRLEDVRRGGFEGLGARMAAGGWTPDFGPSAPHPTAGASAIGARGPLVAYNVNLATDRIDVARTIAGILRASAGGLAGVKALGMALGDRGIVQVSMNLTDYRQTSIEEAFVAVEREAARRGVRVLESEIVGLAPAAALNREIAERVRLRGFSERLILENRLLILDS